MDIKTVNIDVKDLSQDEQLSFMGKCLTHFKNSPTIVKYNGDVTLDDITKHMDKSNIFTKIYNWFNHKF